ncbi:hypothetical protein [Cellulomonas iranensis]|uniref:hypothetical protein n=1 Tax=Cellulomonas iranensis TaxID=76862 RepID=UPI000B3C14C2|nr:hypothetical protein [Cellulomonas iranensis]
MTDAQVDGVTPAPRRWLVSGALLSLTGSAQDPSGGGVRDALLMALALTRRGGRTTPDDVVAGVLGVLGQLGWVASQQVRTATDVPARAVPAALLPSADAATLAPLQHLPTGAARAWAAFLAAPGSRAALVVQGTAGTAPDPVLQLLHVDLTAAVPAVGFPWAHVASPGTLVRHTATLSADTTVWTAEERATLATKVSGAVATQVVDLTARSTT